ncbi:MAG: serine/threonine-protein phosphatase [Gemmataceae bacterium]|nr:serine/threonine-protein phosphatase [Gemmataceae bacterium]
MKILVAWDDPAEAELLTLYLSVGDNEATVVRTREEYLTEMHKGDWTVILMSLSFPTSPDQSFPLFEQTQQHLPEVPMVMACRTTEMLNLAHFLTRGLRFYLVRDGGGDFVFLVLASLESAVAAKRADEARKLAERLREEMDGVRRLQESIIPQGLKPPPGYRISARYEPSQVSVFGDRPVVMAGGDYYDVFRPDERTLVVLIGDASGHGLKACMSIMAMHTLVRMIHGNYYRDTSSFVAEVNQRLCENSIVQSDGGFITMFYAAIDTVDHAMTWTSAGHPLAQVQDLETNEVTQVGTEDEGGLPLAVAPGVDYPAGRFQLPPNSRLLLYSDGLTDAFAHDSPGHQAFGVEGLRKAMQDARDADIDKALEHVFHASNLFTHGSGRHDDTSVVLVERLAEGNEQG